jgi:hypothetical protein
MRHLARGGTALCHLRGRTGAVHDASAPLALGFEAGEHGTFEHPAAGSLIGFGSTKRPLTGIS